MATAPDIESAYERLDNLHQKFMVLPVIDQQGREDMLQEMNTIFRQLAMRRRHPLPEEELVNITDDILMKVANGANINDLGHYFMRALSFHEWHSTKHTRRRNKHEHNFSDMQGHNDDGRDRWRNVAAPASHHDEVEALQHDIIRSIQHLPTNHLTMFVDMLKGYEGKEIARDHGAALGTVKSRLHKIKTLLAEIPHAFPEDCEHLHLNGRDTKELVDMTIVAVQKLVNQREHGSQNLNGSPKK